MKPAMKRLLSWAWRYFSATTAPSSLVEALSVERLPYTALPREHYRSVVAFRRLRGDARRRLAERFIKSHVLGRRA
jgi:hypothetical protein